jgi:hypothetical protein
MQRWLTIAEPGLTTRWSHLEKGFLYLKFPFPEPSYSSIYEDELRIGQQRVPLQQKLMLDNDIVASLRIIADGAWKSTNHVPRTPSKQLQMRQSIKQGFEKSGDAGSTGRCGA